MNGGLPNWLIHWISLVRAYTTGSVKGWYGHANSMSLCTAGWCGLTRPSRNAFGSIISGRLGTTCVIAGRRHLLPSRTNEDIIQTNQERKDPWQPLRARKRLSGVV